MKKLTILMMFVPLMFLTACGDEEAKADTDTNEVEYTKEIYLIGTAKDVREIRSLHDKLIVQLANEKETPLGVAITLMEISMKTTDQSYRLAGAESFEYDFIGDDLDEIQSYVDEKYDLYSEQKELDRLSLNLTITQLESLIGKLENDFKTVYQ